MRPSPAIERLTAPGARQFGVFTLVHALGKGGFAPVWLAREVYGTTELRTVAIKLFATVEDGREGSPSSGTADRRERIFEEARALCQVEHPNIVRFYSMHEDGATGVVGLVMEHVRGTPLDVRLDELHTRGTTMPTDEVIVVGIAVASALNAVHQAGLVHRDIKPANVVEAAGVYKLIDFGIAAAGQRTGAPAVTTAPPKQKRIVLDDLPLVVNTKANALSATLAARGGVESTAFSLTGTMGYIDPHCVSTLATASATSDLYGLGATLYECLAGRIPAVVAAQRAGTDGLRAEVLDGREAPPPLAESRPDLPRSLTELVDRLVAPTPEGRPRSAEAVAWELERIRRDIAGRSRPLPPVEIGPFRGLGRFEQEDRDVYFGRTVEIAASLEMIRSRGVIALVGASGSGKSSLARAGVLPAIMDGGLGRWPKAWDAAIATPGADPRAAIVNALAPIVPDAADRTADALVTALGVRVQTSGRGVVLLVDQFEELATVSSEGGRDFAVRFVARLATQAVPGVRCVVAVRRDLLDPLLAMGELGRALTRGTVLVAPMTDGSWGEVIEQALGVYGYALEDEALRAELLAQLQGTATAMPLVEFALTELWARRDTARKIIPRTALSAIGGVAGALEMHAEATLVQQAKGDPGVVDVARRVLLAMTTAQGTRRSQPRSELRKLDPRAESIVEQLEAGRLVVQETEGVTLAHEALLVQWGRLRGWIAEARADRSLAEEVEREAAAWAKERSTERLWRGRRLIAAEDLAKRGAATLSDAALAFIRAGRSAARRARVVLMGMAVVALGVLIAGGAKYLHDVRQAQAAAEQGQREAKAQAEETQRTLRDALTAQTYVKTQAGGKTGDAILSALKALAIDGEDGDYTNKTRAALLYATLGSDNGLVLPGSSTEPVFLGNDVFLTHDKRVELRSAETGAVRTSFDLPSDVSAIWVTPDDTALMVSTKDRQLLRRDVVSGGISSFQLPKEGFYAISRNGLRMARYADHQIGVFDAGNGALIHQLTEKLKTEPALALVPDGTRLVVVTKSEVSAWDISAGERLMWRKPATNQPRPSFSTDGSLMAIIQSDGFEVWSVETGERRSAFSDWQPWEVRWSRSGRYIVAKASRGTMIVEAQTGRVALELPPNGSVVLSPDDQLMVESTRSDTHVLDRGVVHPIQVEKWASHSADGHRALAMKGDALYLVDVDRHTESVLHVHSELTRARLSDATISADGLFGIGMWEVIEIYNTCAPVLLDLGSASAVSRWQWKKKDTSYCGAGAVAAPSGHRMLVQGPDGWAVLTPPETRPAVILPMATQDAVRFSPDGARVAAPCAKAQVCIWDAATGVEQGELGRTLDAGAPSLKSLAWSPDGASIATASGTRTAQLWNVAAGDVKLVLTDERDAINTLSFAPNGALLASTGPAKAKIWDATTGALRTELGTQTNAVNAAAFSPDGSRLLTCENNSVHLWDVLTAEQVAFSVVPRTSGVCQFGDSEHLLTAGSIIDVNFDRNLEYACQVTRAANTDPAVTALCKVPLERAAARPPRW